MKKYLILIFFPLFLFGQHTNIQKGTFTDTRDGQQYNWILLDDGNKWMTENVNYEIGPPWYAWMASKLSYAFANSWCYNIQLNNCINHGRLYNWLAAKTACPKGWRLPTDEEWIKLAELYGGYHNLINAKDSNNPKGSYSLLRKQNGFNASLSGARTAYGGFLYLDEFGHYWTSSFDGERALYYGFDKKNQRLYRNKSDTNWAFSCRCIQNDKP